MKPLFLVICFFSTGLIFSQTQINGIVQGKDGKPISGVNIYIRNSYDGATSQEDGSFVFSTSENGVQTLIISYISFETLEITKDVLEMKNLKLVLEEDVNTLGAVTISAGSFSAGDQSKVNFLKPLDIVTTASAVGDFVGALQTLPGTTMNAEDGRLFVRGGDAKESLIFIDGIRVFTPYTVSASDSPVRGRYSPFLFDGMTFSTGGYSAEYGQALSSVLLLNTMDEYAEEQTNIGILSLGGNIGHTKKWKTNSLSINASYINLEPYEAVFPDKNDWQKPYEAFSGETVFRQQIGDGLLKFYNAFESTGFALTQKNINAPEGNAIDLNDRNFYSNLSYLETLSKGWNIFAGGSFTYSRTNILFDETGIKDTENDFHFKIKSRKRFNNKFSLNFGGEYFITNFSEQLSLDKGQKILNFNQNIAAAYAEADYLVSRKLAFKPGVRFEHNSYLKDQTLSLRIAMAYKTGKNDQISLAYGKFLQSPENDVLKFTNHLRDQQAEHYILSYERVTSGRIFRAELYRKDYNRLISYDDAASDYRNFSNDGSGYAQGLDLFLRDNKSVKNMDYWISYSLIDSERQYEDYPVSATPSFVNKHNVSIVGKYWVNAIKSQIGISYQYGSGRPYTDKNEAGFLQETAKSYNNVSFNLAYLLSRQKILYIAVSNIFGFKNNYGYRYSNTADSSGMFASEQMSASRDQLFFVGFFWTISSDKMKNQLKNL